MTDTEQRRIDAICKVARVKDIGDLSDGYHTFNGLYYQRMILFATLVKVFGDKAWKSFRHEDGELCFGGGWFIVGIDTPKGSYTYHYGIQYWDVFDCEILPRAKHWDGHTDKDVTRLMSLSEPQLNCSEIPNNWISCSERLPEKNGVYIVSYEDACTWLEWFNGKWFFYPSNPAREETGAITAWMPMPEPYQEVEE